MQHHRLVSLLSLLAAAGVAVVVAAAAAPATDQPLAAEGALSPAQRYDDALRLFREGRFAAAYGRVAALADGGYLPAAQLALVMHDQGSSLFGSDWFASPDQRRRWNTLVINAARQRVELPENDGGD